MAKKVFVLGLGCQKGGTTWLHNYLRAHPNTAMGIRKEYHVFDALHIPICSHFRKKNVGKSVALYEKGMHWLSRKDREKILHASFYADQAVYFDYFRDLVEHNDSLLTGDITPSYCGLPPHILYTIKTELEARDFVVKVVFLMRDPVSRCISAMRMKRRKYGRLSASENDDLREMHKTPDFELRTRYEITIGNIDDVFDPGNVYYGFYEQLFNQETMKVLCQLLTIPYHQPNLNKKINIDKSNFVIADEVKRAVAQYYGSTYEFVSQRFGETLIRNIWPSFSRLAETV